MMSEANPYSAPLSDLVEENQVSDNVVLASRGLRLWGAIIDSIFLMIPYLVIIFFIPAFYNLQETQYGVKEHVLSIALSQGIYLLLNGYLLHHEGQTIGKKILGMQIVDVHDNKVPSLLKTYVLRSLLLSIPASIEKITLFVVFINPLFIFGSAQRCLHDYIAGTKVIKLSK